PDVLATDDLLHRPITTLYKYIRPNGLDQLHGCVLVEDHHRVHAAQGGDHVGPFLLGVQWPVIPLSQASYARIAVDAYDQTVAQVSCLLQIGDVPSVEDIEDAVREHDPVALQAPDTGHALYAHQVHDAGWDRSVHEVAGRFNANKSRESPPSTISISVWATHNSQPIASASGRM